MTGNVLSDPDWPEHFMLVCPQCGRRQSIDEAEGLGADEGCVFCCECLHEFPVDAQLDLFNDVEPKEGGT